MTASNQIRHAAGAAASQGGKFAPMGRSTQGGNLELPADVDQPIPAVQPARTPTDREMLDSIAVRMAESSDRNADLTDDIAAEIVRSGRPHPGETILTAEEKDLIEDGGDDVDEAVGRAYQAKMHLDRAAAAVPMRVDPADTMALLNAHSARAHEANSALELTAAKALAQMIKKEWPNAAYLKMDTSETSGRVTPTAVLDKDFDEIADHQAILDSTDDLYGVTDHLTDEGAWTNSYREYDPKDTSEWEPCLALSELQHLDLESVGAGPAPQPAEAVYTGQESKVTGQFGNVILSPRDGEPGTIIMVDTSGNRSGEPLVVIINDHVIDIAQ